METGPRWYRELYKKFAKDNPMTANEGYLKSIEAVEIRLAKGDIPTWDDFQFIQKYVYQ